MITIENGVVFVGSGDNPDDREVLWARGHVDKEEFAKQAGKLESEVLHVYSEIDDEEGPAFWSHKKTTQMTDPITMAFDP